MQEAEGRAYLCYPDWVGALKGDNRRGGVCHGRQGSEWRWHNDFGNEDLTRGWGGRRGRWG